MTVQREVRFVSAIVFLLLGYVSHSDAADSKPMKVFILAGQSNMEGHAKIETFDYMADDPATAPLLKQMRAPDGSPHVCENVWITYLTGTGDNNGEGLGKLTAGFGSRQNPAVPGGKIGPEFTFGLTMDAAFDEPVLIIKAAWGGKSLYYDFRPPSSKGITDAGMAHLAAIKSLRSIILGDPCKVGAKGIATLADLPNLNKIALGTPSLNDDAIPFVSKMKNLDTLELTSEGFTDVALGNLKELPNLKSLTLGSPFRQPAMTDAGLKSIAGIDTLKTLVVKCDTITAKAISDLKISKPNIIVRR